MYVFIISFWMVILTGIDSPLAVSWNWREKYDTPITFYYNPDSRALFGKIQDEGPSHRVVCGLDIWPWLYTDNGHVQVSIPCARVVVGSRVGGKMQT